MPEINQSHYGSGDNVARDKIVYSMQSGDFRTVVQSIMLLIQFEKYDETKHKLKIAWEKRKEKFNNNGLGDSWKSHNKGQTLDKNSNKRKYL